MKYVVAASEQHADGNPHLHAYMKLYAAVTIGVRTLDLIVENETYHPNVRTVLGRPRAVIEYVKKGETWCEWGDDPTKADRLEQKEKVAFATQHTLRECAESGHFSLFELNAIQRLKDTLAMSERVWGTWEPRKVWWFYGDTGTGKTRVAMRYATQYPSWVKLNGNLKEFVNGYDHQEAVVIDDLRAGGIDFEQLLALTDGYCTMVKIKGGYREWRARLVIITAPKRPEEVFLQP